MGLYMLRFYDKILIEGVITLMSPAPSTAGRDTSLKYNIYMRAGVREYWMVDQEREKQEYAFYEAAYMKVEIDKILDILEEEYPHAACALDHKEIFELLVAVILSAQTTDKSVNSVTPKLFERYPDARALSQADEQELMEIIRRIGMYKTKANNLSIMARQLTAG